MTSPRYLLALALLTLPVAAQTVSTQTVDTGTNGSTGQHTSQAIVNGNPAIAYYHATESSLMFARNSAADGSGTWTISTVDSSGDVGQYTSLKVVNGNPAISYYDTTNGDLKYVRATDASGTAWGTPVTVDSIGDAGYDVNSSGDVGQYTSLAVVNGNPAISYYDASHGDLLFVRALDAGGTSWGTPMILDYGSMPGPLNYTGNVGGFTSLAVLVNGSPAISYYDVTNSDLKYVQALDAGGTSWGVPVTLDSSGLVGFFTSLAVVDGNPAISYNDGTLKYVRALDASGNYWGTPMILDGGGNLGSYSSLALVDGNPAISYWDEANFDLRYVRALDAGGTSWGTPVTLDSSGQVGAYTSLVALVNGNPAVSYYDLSNGDLKWATLTFDADTDGLLDAWELTYWPTTTGHGPLDDEDKDGIVELLELALGLNPTVPNAGGIPALTEEGGYLTMTLTKQPGVTYEIQSAATLPGPFSAATTTVLINNPTTLKVRDNVLFSTPPARFMRVQVTGAP